MKKIVVIVLLFAVAACMCYLVFRNTNQVAIPENVAITPLPERPVTSVNLDPVVDTNKPGQVSENVVPLSPEDARNDLLARLGEVEPSPHVLVLLGLDGDKSDYKTRAKALKELTRNLSEDDAVALTAFLEFRASENTELQPLYFNSLKNDALDTLLRQTEIQEGIGAHLARMFADEKHDEIWRDYCIQYMSPYYKERWSADDAEKADAEPDAEQKAIHAAYAEALTHTENTFAGTALLGMEDLSRTFSAFDKEMIGTKAEELATNDDACEAVRITSLSMAAMMGRTNALPSARMLAQTGETVTLRMAAVAALGSLGSIHDRELLASLQQDSEERIRKIAEAAVTKLDARMTDS
jgi:hypothetical protein